MLKCFLWFVCDDWWGSGVEEKNLFLFLLEMYILFIYIEDWRGLFGLYKSNWKVKDYIVKVFLNKDDLVSW